MPRRWAVRGRRTSRQSAKRLCNRANARASAKPASPGTLRRTHPQEVREGGFVATSSHPVHRRLPRRAHRRFRRRPVRRRQLGAAPHPRARLKKNGIYQQIYCTVTISTSIIQCYCRARVAPFDTEGEYKLEGREELMGLNIFWVKIGLKNTS